MKKQWAWGLLKGELYVALEKTPLLEWKKQPKNHGVEIAILRTKRSLSKIQATLGRRVKGAGMA